MSRHVRSMRELAERLLDRIVRIVVIPTYAHAESIHAVVVGSHEKRQRSVVTSRRSRELLVVKAHARLFCATEPVEIPIIL